MGTDLNILLPRLRRFARCLYCSGPDADNAVCDALEATIALGHITSDAIVATELWLFQSIVDAARRHFKNGGSTLPMINDDAGNGEPPGRIEPMMAELNFEQRAIIAVHVLEGISLENSSSVLNTPLSEVRNNLRTARDRLAADFAPGEPFEHIVKSVFDQPRP